MRLHDFAIATEVVEVAGHRFARQAPVDRLAEVRRRATLAREVSELQRAEVLSLSRRFLSLEHIEAAETWLTREPRRRSTGQPLGSSQRNRARNLPGP